MARIIVRKKKTAFGQLEFGLHTQEVRGIGSNRFENFQFSTSHKAVLAMGKTRAEIMEIKFSRHIRGNFTVTITSFQIFSAAAQVGHRICRIYSGTMIGELVS